MTGRLGRQVTGGPRSRWWAATGLLPLGLLGLLGLLGTAGCGVLPGGSSSEQTRLSLSLRHDLSPGLRLSGADLAVLGTTSARASISVEAGGFLRSADEQGGEPGLRFPAYQPTETPPVAIVAISSDDPDWLQPGSGPLAFGADVQLDAMSSGTTSDNGDNLVQRGLFTSDSQFKLQADKRHPSCLVRGDQGSVLVVSPVTLAADEWYRLACRRDADRVELTVSRLQGGDLLETTRSAAEGSIGKVSFPSSTRLSVGGKLAEADRPATASDQFNGSVAKVFVDLGEGS